MQEPYLSSPVTFPPLDQHLLLLRSEETEIFLALFEILWSKSMEHQDNHPGEGQDDH